MNKLTETQKAYLAGLFDGEGCVSILKYRPKGNNRSFVYCLLIVISQNDEAFINHWRDTVGLGSIHTRKRDGAIDWHMRTWDAVCFLEAIYDHLWIKKEQALVAINFVRIPIDRVGKGGKVTQRVIDKRERAYLLLHEMKGRSGVRGRPVIVQESPGAKERSELAGVV